MSLADEVRTVRERVAARLSELEPLVREYDELVKLADELGIEVSGRRRSRSAARAVGDDTRESGGADAVAGESAAAAPRRRSRQPAGSPPRSKPARQRRRAPGEAETGAERDARVIDALRAHPGSTITDLASMLGVPPTSLYRPVRELTTSGEVVKRGRGLFVED